MSCRILNLHSIGTDLEDLITEAKEVGLSDEQINMVQIGNLADLIAGIHGKTGPGAAVEMMYDYKNPSWL